jgi:hypothetical protein
VLSKFVYGKSKTVGVHEMVERDVDILIRQSLNAYVDICTPQPKVWQDIKNRIIAKGLNVGCKTSC